MIIGSLSNKFKKFITAVLIVATLVAAIGSLSCVAYAEGDSSYTKPIAEGGPDIKAESAVVMDVNTGAVLFAKNATTTQQPSSLTKLVTSYAALRNLNVTDLITVSATAADINFPTAAEIGYITGENITVLDAIKGTLLCSAEDCAYSLAERTSGSADSFANLMNQAAEELGFVNSSFKNPLGKYQEGHYSCAYDMAKVAAALMKDNADYRTILSSKRVNLGATNNRNAQVITSTHRFMNDIDNCDYVYAAKTGGSAYGGDKTWALCTYAKYKNLDVVCIVMGSPTNDSTYADTKTILNYVWDSFDDISSNLLINNASSDVGAMFNDISMFNISNKNTIYVDNSSLTTLPLHYNPELITSKVSFKQISEFIYGENVIGKISFFYNGVFCGDSNIIYYTETVSMTESEFAKIFPAYLKAPNSNTITYVTGNTSHKKSTSIFSKIKAGVLTYYTPAKTFSFVIGFVIFLIGGLIILLVFPTKKKVKEGNLYSSLYDNIPVDDYEGETGNLRRMRTSTDIDMQEINSTSSYSDNRKKR